MTNFVVIQIDFSESGCKSNRPPELEPWLLSMQAVNLCGHDEVAFG